MGRAWRPGRLEPFKPFPAAVAAYPGLTSSRLLGVICERSYSFDYAAMTDFLREVRRVRLPPFEVRRDPPGEQAQSGSRRALAVNTKSPNKRDDRFKHFCMTAVARSRLPSQRSRNLSIGETEPRHMIKRLLGRMGRPALSARTPPG
jgi:hypothetical protein